MKFITPETRLTADGSPTLVCPATGDTYHSVNGAVEESMHVFIRGGFLGVDKQEVSVLEAGFGSGLNAWLTAREASAVGRRVRYTAVELFPVGESVWSRPEFPQDDLFRAIHRAGWESEEVVAPDFRLRKINSDLAGTVFDVKFDVVYFDMFAPDTCPQLWNVEVFSGLAACMEPGAVLVTYSAKGDVKRALRAAGFEVTRRPGASGKRHMLKAIRL